MKYFKLLFTSLLLVAFSFSVSAHSDVQHKNNTELVKHQSDVSISTPFANYNDVVFTVVTVKIPSISVYVPQIPFVNFYKPTIYGGCGTKECFLANSPYFYFYKNEQFFSRNNITKRENYLYNYKNVQTSRNKNSSHSRYGNYRNYSYSMCFLQ